MKLEINAAKLAEGLAMTLPCAGKDLNIPTLNAVAMHVREDGSVALVTTNRYLLAEYIIPAEHVGSVDTVETGTFLVPAPTATEWAKLAKREARAHPNGPVTLTVESQNATLADYNTSLSERLVDGEHVRSWERLIPEPDDAKTVPALGLKPAYLDAMSKTAKAAGKNLTVRLDFTEPNGSALWTVQGVDAFRGIVMAVRLS